MLKYVFLEIIRSFFRFSCGVLDVLYPLKNCTCPKNMFFVSREKTFDVHLIDTICKNNINL